MPGRHSKLTSMGSDKTQIDSRKLPRDGMVLFVMLVVVVTQQCSPYSPKTHFDPPIEISPTYSKVAESAEIRGQWWKEFGSPELDTLISQVLKQNLSLRQALHRVSQAKAMVDRNYAGKLPDVSGELAVSRAQTVMAVGNLPPQTTVSNQFGLTVAASYEVDVWQKISSQIDAAQLDVDASEMDRQALAVTLVGQTVDAYLTVAEQKQLLDLLHAQITVNKTYQELLEVRFSNGLASMVEVLQQRQQVATLTARLPTVTSQLEIAQNQLSILVGKMPTDTGDINVTTLPTLPDRLAIGVPTDLLRHRPDLRSAEIRIAAADHRVAAAVADRFPVLRLTGRTGFSDKELSTFFESWIWNIGASIAASIFDGGRRAAEVERAKAQVEELLWGYGQQILVAVREVEDALALEMGHRQRFDALTLQRNLANRTMEEARLRYVQGLSDYLTVLTALRSLQQVEQEMLTTQRQILSARVQLNRALGGMWIADKDAASTPPKAEKQ
ncbi:MAG: efflux transporter outer membrane subunit [Myxococcales bacterium]|nr:efflux transporter outer membrane subunit [Myxococcales bacterium]